MVPMWEPFLRLDSSQTSTSNTSVFCQSQSTLLHNIWIPRTFRLLCTGTVTGPSGDEHSENGRAGDIATSGDHDESISESGLSDIPMSSNSETLRQKNLTWSSISKNGVLAVIVLARLAEPLTQRSPT